ncbi:MAG: RecQ family ATP-dependent DNA helicase [Planctomycetes bacterium]|nr:RecQ family ATP-dependent DNA helicase [Planctomycetota bacterium]
MGQSSEEGMSDPNEPQIFETLRSRFGFEAFRPGQEEVVRHLVAGRSTAAVFPTGAGKSLCYQLPALLLDGLTIVVSPLIALMKDQIDALTQRGIEAVRLDSSLDDQAYRAAMDGIRSGRVRLVYVSPERFNNERFRDFVMRQKIALFAVDEAHCISEWGHNFRPDYLKLAEFARAAGAERIFALTATATPTVLGEICRLFAIDPDCAVRTGFYRENLALQVSCTDATSRDHDLMAELDAHPPGPTIVYVSIQKTAMELAQTIAATGRDARPYHAGMDAALRTATQDWFLSSDDGIVVATIAFGMGIDKPDIRYVHHYNLSKSLEAYSQEVGRAGRDELPARCVTFYCPDDLVTLQNFALGDTPTDEAVRRFVAELLESDDTLELGLYAMARACDIRPLVLRTLLVYLELEGFLAGGTPIYSSFRFIPQTTSAEMLAAFPESRRPFLAAVLKQSKKARTWFSLDAADVAERLSVDRRQVIALLDELANRGFLRLEGKDVRHRYQVLRRPDDADALAVMLHDRLQAREKRELKRLDDLVDLFLTDGCIANRLGEHFGEHRSQPCGHCSSCLVRAAGGE